MRSGLVTGLVMFLLALFLVPLAFADGGAWGDTIAPPPIRTVTIGLCLMALTVLGALFMYILGMEDEHWRRGRHY